MRVRKVYIIVVPSLNLDFVAYNRNQLEKIKKQLEHENLRFYVQDKIYQ